MILRGAIYGSITACASTPALAKTWFCMASLSVAAGSGTLPDNPTVFELDLQETGQFVARGETRNIGQIAGFDWDGRWTSFEDGLALIGTRVSEQGVRSELRALTTLVHEDIIILRLTETAPFGQTVRCLHHEQG